MYAIVITRLVKAAMIFAISTFTSIVICIFMVRIPLNCSLTALLDYVMVATGYLVGWHMRKHSARPSPLTT
jgi:hypothetical protein